MNLEEIGKNIEKLRIANKLKQKDFAARLGISRPTVSNWEQGKNPPTTDQLFRIAEEFKVSIDELLSLKKSKKISSLWIHLFYVVDLEFWMK